MFAAPAQPVYQNQYTPPKLVSRAAGTLEPAGKGSVTVQVQLDVHGKVVSTRILRTSNSGDNAAALEIAQHSTYATAMRGSKPVRSIYDFIINFGQSVVSAAASQIDGLLHQSQWQQAKDTATAALAKTPNDQLVQAQLGVANAFLHDIANSAAAFDKAGKIPTQYATVASQVYALNSRNIVGTEPKVALQQAQNAVSLAPNDFSGYYSLGLAQHANQQDPQALASFQKAASLTATTGSAATQTDKVNIAEGIMQVNIAQGNTAGADQVRSQIDAMDPTHKLSSRVMAFYYDAQGVALQNKGDAKSAIAMYEKAATTDPQWAGPTDYTKAAIAYINQAVPDYLSARHEADKAVAMDQNFALAYYVAGVALSRNYLLSNSETENDSANVYLGKAASLAHTQGNAKLEQLALGLTHDRRSDANLQAIGGMLQENTNNSQLPESGGGLSNP